MAKLHDAVASFDLEQLSSPLSDKERNSSEVIFVMLLEAASPAGRGFPDLFNQPY